MEKKLHDNLTVRLFTDVKCFGPGIASLLHRVQEMHSLRAAAIDMEMAYSKAWTILRNAERGLGFKLLVSSTGGKNGGGATLTPEAQQLLSAYDAYCQALREYGEALFAEKFAFYGQLEKTEL